MFYGNLVQLGKKSNSVIRSRSVMVNNWCNVLSMGGVTVCGHHPECRVTFGRGGPLRKFYGRYGDLTKQYEVPLSRMLHDILDDDHIQ